MMKCSQKLPLLLQLSCFLVDVVHCGGGHFGYDKDSYLIPSNWSALYGECGGFHQSPINIESSTVEKIKLPKLTFTGTVDTSLPVFILNTGSSVQLRLFDGYIMVSGGVLRGAYAFDSLHFHWGEDSTVGSEHLIDGRHFTLELHMVFYKAEYGTLEHAEMEDDGITVLGVLHAKSTRNNVLYNDLLNGLNDIEIAGSTKNLSLIFIMDFLPKDRTHYFTYNGSLTTPPCREIVTWIVFKEPMELSIAQASKFRNSLRNFDGFFLHKNYRPIQDLNYRNVFFNVENIGSFVDFAQLILIFQLIVIYFLNWRMCT